MTCYAGWALKRQGSNSSRRVILWSAKGTSLRSDLLIGRSTVPGSEPWRRTALSGSYDFDPVFSLTYWCNIAVRPTDRLPSHIAFEHTNSADAQFREGALLR